MKIFLTSFFLLIFSLQILPVMEIGKALFKQQLTEEINEGELGIEDDCNELTEKLSKENIPCPFPEYYASKWASISYTNRMAPYNNHYLKQFTPDILTPPPNC